MKLKSKELIGKLTSGMLVDGHVYYRDNVIKVRYDLLSRIDCKMLNEENFFDEYMKIFPC